MALASIGGELGGMGNKIQAGRMAGRDGWLAATARWLDEQLFYVGYSVGFRLRLLRMALRRRDRIPTLVMMALEAPEHDVRMLLDSDAWADWE